MRFVDTWVSLYQQRTEWAFAAQDRFFDAFRNERVKKLYVDNRQSDVFVAVFGPSQVGKTTLILRLLGVAPERMRAVSTALRGGRPEGESATATSTIYAVSPDEHFYVGGLSEGEATRCPDEAALCEQMRAVRIRAESDPTFGIEPVEILIPQQYFDPAAEAQILVRVIDLPGIDSAAAAEHAHVRKVIHHYVPLANLVLLVNQANQLSWFEHFGIEALDHWVLLPEKFRVILTYSVSNESIQELLQHADKDGFRAHFRQEFRRTFATFPEEGIPIYPLEYGNSWEKFLASGQATPWQRELMHEMLAELRRDINASANEYNKIRINYRLFALVEAHLQQKAQDLDAEARRLATDITGAANNLQEWHSRLAAVATEQQEVRERAAKLALPAALSELPRPAGGGDAHHVSTLRSWIGQAIAHLVEAGNKVIVQYEEAVAESELYHARVQRLAKADLSPLASATDTFLDEYLVGWYARTSRWERDRDRVRSLIDALHTFAVKRVAELVAEDRHRGREGLQRREATLVSLERQLTDEIENLRCEHEALKTRQAEHNDVIEAFHVVAALDRQTAQQFRHFVTESFRDTYGRHVTLVNQAATPATGKWLHTAFLALLQKEYLKLTEGI